VTPPPEPPTRFGLLGTVAAIVDGVPVSVGGPKQRCVLSLLLLEPGQVVSRERLVDAVWGEDPPDDVANALQAAVSRLRRVLGGRAGTTLVARGAGYAVDVEPSQVDLHLFRELTAEARARTRDGDDAGAAPLFDRAIALWRGAPLSDVGSDLVQQRLVPGLAQERVAALVDAHDVALRMDQGPRVVPNLLRLVEEHPFEERFRLQLMLALHGCGQVPAALAVYQRWRGLLAREHGIEPGERLQSVQREMLRGAATVALVRRYASVAGTAGESAPSIAAGGGDIGHAWAVTACQAQQPLARATFGLLGVTEVEHVSAAATAVLLGVPNDRAETALHALLAANLLETTSTEDGPCYRIPPALRSAAVAVGQAELDRAVVTAALGRVLRHLVAPRRVLVDST
jgi:DNA-binding SARP family transcriptional activator